MTSDPTLKRSGKEMMLELKGLLLSPKTIFHFALVLTIPLWVNPVVYVILKTFTFDTYGIIAWVLLCGIAFYCLRSWGMFFMGMSAYSKKLRPLLQAKRNGEVEAIQKILDLRSVKPNPHLMTPWSLYLCQSSLL
ncbi:MAG: hypothetical protein WCG75_13025 [Armatimonadota bacterium]